MKHHAPRAVGELIDTALPQLRERLLGVRVARAWAGLVGPDMARRARPRGVVAGTLEVVVDNSPWLHELTLRGPDVTRLIRASFPELTALRFVLGSMVHDERDTVTERAPRLRALTDDERRDIDDAVRTIADPTLATAARRLMTRARRSMPVSERGREANRPVSAAD
jgi:hypothetical protein